MADGNIKIDAGEMNKLVEIFNNCVYDSTIAILEFQNLADDLDSLYDGKADQVLLKSVDSLKDWVVNMYLIYAALSTFITNTHAQFSNVDSTKGEHADSAIETEETTKEN